MGYLAEVGVMSVYLLHTDVFVHLFRVYRYIDIYLYISYIYSKKNIYIYIYQLKESCFGLQRHSFVGCNNPKVKDIAWVRQMA